MSSLLTHTRSSEGAAPRQLPHATSDDGRPVLVVGVSTCAELEEVIDAAGAGASGYTPWIWAVAASGSRAAALLGGPGSVPRQAADSGRLRVFDGVTTVCELEGALRERVASLLPSGVVRLAGAEDNLAASTADLLARVRSEQSAEYEMRAARVAARAQVRDVTHWRDRYTAALGGNDSGDPLRVAVIASRHSTYIGHAGGDLARAFEACGHVVGMLTEPDMFTRLSGLAFVRAMEAFDPDLVVSINYPRGHFQGAIPDSVPFVTWVQDALSHLFAGVEADDGAARAGRFDYVVGHAYRRLVEVGGLPPGRVLRSAVTASEAKFHAGPVDYADRARFECDVAYASNHSESPRAYVERFLAENPLDRRREAAVRAIAERVIDATERSAEVSTAQVCDEAARELVTSGWNRRGPGETQRVLQCFVLPVAEKAIRHQTLRWAAAIAGRRAWRLHIYGNGWDGSPGLRPFARPMLAHGEELRAAYALAGAHLHASVSSLAHQRVAECALSGGVTLCRFVLDEWMYEYATAAAEARERRMPAWCRFAPDRACWPVVDTPRLARLCRDHQAMGLARFPAMTRVHSEMQPSDEGWDWIDKVRGAGRFRLAPVVRDLAESCFVDEQDLERLLEPLVERRGHRAGVSRMQRTGVQQRMTTGSLSRRIVQLVAEDLGALCEASAVVGDTDA